MNAHSSIFFYDMHTHKYKCEKEVRESEWRKHLVN